MLRTILLSATVFAAASCVPGSGDSPIRILNLHLPVLGDSACTVAPGDPVISSTSLDIGGFVGAGVKPQLLVQVDLESILDPEFDRVGDDTLAGSERMDFYIDAVTLAYTNAADNSAFVPAQRVVRYGVIRPGAGFEAVQDLLPQTAADAVVAALPAGGAAIDLLVGIQFEGHTPAGLVLRSTQIQFPVTLLHRAFGACAAGTVPAPAGPCGTIGGQHGTVPACVAPTTP